jgi:hypothetical protein
MKYTLVLTLLVMVGCAAKHHESPIAPEPPGRHYKNCKEISINAKTGETTFVCPPQVKK